MSPLKPCAIYFLSLLVSVKSAFPPSLRYPLPIASNQIINTNVTCDSGSFNATINLQHPFKGVLFAKDFSQECRSFGLLSNTVSISLPTSGCGVRLSTKMSDEGVIKMFYSVTLVAQQDRHLRQIADQEKLLECFVKEDVFAVSSAPMAEVLKNEYMERHAKNFRVGRMEKNLRSEEEFENETETNMESEEVAPELDEALLAARAWMEITPEEESRPLDTLQVGDTALLTIKSTLPAGIGWKVVDCVAHDGLGDSSQRLIDEEGCPIDELLLPIPRLGIVQPISLMRHQEAVSKFAAFKFPDRDRLHLSCGLELCRGACSKVNCGDKIDSRDNRLGRTLSKGEDGEILDRLKVFNSVEVRAPAIDDLRKSERLQISEPSTFSFSNLPGDRTFCVSPDKIAITFCILGVIFLCAVVVAACALLRARRSSTNGPFYTRSIFSSSSGGSAYGSKLLLHESPCMGQSTSRGMHYGRIL